MQLKPSSFSLHRLSGMIGNLLEHYDNALFGLLAPFIAPIFFKQSDPLTGLILTYGMLPLGILARPLGSLFFGWIGDSWGRKRALSLSLTFMAIITMAMGFLPTYDEAGVIAPILLALVRLLQNFCSSGESIGGAIFVLEHTDQNKRSLVSSFYDVSSIAGILLASLGVTVLCYDESIDTSWRYLMWGGAATGVMGIILRFFMKEGKEYLSEKSEQHSVWMAIRIYRKELFAVILVSGFAYTTYSLAVTLMNGYVPLVTSLSKAKVMSINTILLVLDMCLLPCFGYLALRLSKEKMMFGSALLAFVIAIPLFVLLQEASLTTVVTARVLLIVVGVAFSATYHAWAQELLPPRFRYTILSLGYALGSQLIGAPTSVASLWLYKKTGWVGAPALYLMITASLASVALYQMSFKTASNPLSKKLS